MPENVWAAEPAELFAMKFCSDVYIYLRMNYYQCKYKHVNKTTKQWQWMWQQQQCNEDDFHVRWSHVKQSFKSLSCWSLAWCETCMGLVEGGCLPETYLWLSVWGDSHWACGAAGEPLRCSGCRLHSYRPRRRSAAATFKRSQGWTLN